MWCKWFTAVELISNIWSGRYDPSSVIKHWSVVSQIIKLIKSQSKVKQSETDVDISLSTGPQSDGRLVPLKESRPPDVSWGSEGLDATEEVTWRLQMTDGSWSMISGASLIISWVKVISDLILDWFKFIKQRVNNQKLTCSCCRASLTEHWTFQCFCHFNNKSLVRHDHLCFHWGCTAAFRTETTVWNVEVDHVYIHTHFHAVSAAAPGAVDLVPGHNKKNVKL